MADALAFRVLLKEAMEQANVSQEQLGQALGGLHQTTVGAWVTGKQNPPPPDTVFATEAALGVAPGHLSRSLGYVPAEVAPASTVPDAIDADPALDPDAREVLLAGYSAMVSSVASRRKPS